MKTSMTRKAHRKSRNGCLGCKSRHIKCDEQKPSCANCVKQGAECEYRVPPSRGASASREALQTSPLPGGTPAFTSSSDAGGTSSNGGGGGGGIGIGTGTALNVPQLRLLHHYMTSTAKTLAINTGAEDIYKKTLLEIAFNNPYLLQSTLSLSALHMSRLAPPEEAKEYLQQAERYREAALKGFQTTVHDIDDSNFKAVLLFAGTLFPHACVTSITASKDLDYTFESIVSNLVLTRRMRPMVATFYDQVQGSELDGMIPNDVKDVDWNAEEPPLETELVHLRQFSNVFHHFYPPDIVEAYRSACRLLELVFHVATTSPKPPSSSLLQVWMHLVPDRYMELLSEKQPGALIIFAHFAVIMNRVAEYYWYLEGVAEQILWVADHLVPTEWKAWLQWPKEQIPLVSKPQTPASDLATCDSSH